MDRTETANGTSGLQTPSLTKDVSRPWAAGVAVNEALKTGRRASPSSSQSLPTDTCWCIHIGMPKTGSTTLQRHLFSQHPEFTYVGKDIDLNTENCARQAGALMQVLLKEASANPLDDTELTNGKKWLGELLRQKLREHRVPVWSEEGMAAYSSHSMAKAKLLSRLCPRAKIILFARNPFRFAVSRYLEQLKRANHAPKDPRRFPPAVAQIHTKNFDAGVRRWGPAPVYFDIETWFEKVWPYPEKPDSALSVLQYGTVANIYADLFGRESVRVVLFEEFAQDNGRVIAELCRFVGVDAELGVRLTSEHDKNGKWSAIQLERLRKIVRSRWRSYLFGRVSQKWRDRMLRRPPRREQHTQRDAPKARVEIPDLWKERLSEYTRDQSRILKEEWGLPVDKYGYPM